MIASEPEWTVARDGAAVIRISRRSQSAVVLGSPALATVLAAARANAVHMNLQRVIAYN